MPPKKLAARVRTSPLPVPIGALVPALEGVAERLHRPQLQALLSRLARERSHLEVSATPSGAPSLAARVQNQGAGAVRIRKEGALVSGGQGRTAAVKASRACQRLYAARPAAQKAGASAESSDKRGLRLEAEAAAREDAARRRTELLRQRLLERQRREQARGARCSLPSGLDRQSALELEPSVRQAGGEPLRRRALERRRSEQRVRQGLYI